MMAVKIITSRGIEYVFNPSFRVEGLPVERDIPTLTVEGRDGEIVHPDMLRVRARTITVSGHIYADTPDAAQAALDAMRAAIAPGDEVRIYRDSADARFVSARFQGDVHAYVQGTNRTVASCRLTFIASDPYVYAEAFTQVTIDPVGWTPPVTIISVENPGNAPVWPALILIGKSSGGLNVSNPRLVNHTMGCSAKYTGSLAAGEKLVLDTARRRALKVTNNIETSGTAQGGGADYVRLAASASASDGAYLGRVIKLTGGAGAGQVRRITSYSGVSKVAFVDRPWTTAPDATTTYVVYSIGFLEGYYLEDAQTGAFSGGTSIIDAMDSAYLVHGFPLAPGTNRIEIADDNSLVGIAFLFRARWY